MNKTCNDNVGTYTAECVLGEAEVDIFVHGNNFTVGGGDVLYPPSWCEAPEDASVCHFTYVVSCDTACNHANRALDEKIGGKRISQGKKCRKGASVDDARSIPVDKCVYDSKTQPLKVTSKDEHTVTFTLSQLWKDFHEDNEMAWVAIDYVTPVGDLRCLKTEMARYGVVSSHTAQCTDGAAIVDLYVHDGSEASLFGQQDGSALAVPDACNPTGDQTKICHFRFVLNCMEPCTNFESEDDTSAHLRGA